MSYQVLLGYVPISSKALRPLEAAYIPILLSEVEQEQRPSGNGSGTFRHQPFGRQYGVGHMGDKSVDQMG